jgi:hypothetical protein
LSRASSLALFAGAALLAPAAADAYCRQTTHEDDTCRPDPGIPLFWQGNCVMYSVSELGSQDLPLETTLAVVRHSFETWEETGCSYLTFQPTVLASCEDVGFRQDAGNMNLVVFRESGWSTEYNHAPAAMGLTTVLFDPGSGEILSADMELNGDNFRFTDGPFEVDADLANTVTHEAGHVLGLAHSPEAAATMYGTSTSGEVQKATLHEDDIRAVCDSYPIASDPGVCMQPTGGLDPECLPPEGGCCRVAGGGSGDGPVAIAIGALVLAAARWRRRRPSR